MLAALLAALIAHRRWGRGFYTRWREALALVAVLHLQWSVRLLGERTPARDAGMLCGACIAALLPC